MAKKSKKIDPPQLSILDALTGEVSVDSLRYELESLDRMIELWDELQPESWRDLAFQLMRRYDPSFQTTGTRGRPKKWTDSLLMILAGEFHRLREHEGCRTNQEAFFKLSKKEPWSKLIEKRSDDNKGYELDNAPDEALRVALANARKGIVQAGIDAYLFHYKTGTLDEWEKYLKLIPH